MNKTEKTSLIYAVDFDDTICFSHFPELGEPNLPVIQELIRLRKNGNKLILWTCRNNEPLQKAVDFCKSYGLEFDAVNENLPEVLDYYDNIDSRKITADVYLDDKSITPEQLYKSADSQPIKLPTPEQFQEALDKMDPEVLQKILNKELAELDDSESDEPSAKDDFHIIL